MQWVRTLNGVRYYNDSKATNVGSVKGSLTGFPYPVILIAGGRDKHGDYAPLRPVLRDHVKSIIVLGEAADRIADAYGDLLPIFRVRSMEQAVRKGRELARSGEAVVLSPACSSYDMFNNYEHRGQVFAAAVQALSP
jgi:UDP-N-acetylmuramoylalanine--D-glutamate ligase